MGKSAAIVHLPSHLHMCLASVIARALEANAPRKRIYMHFVLREAWFCQFLEEDLKTPLPKKITLKDSAKLFEIAERGGYKLTLENKRAIENAITMGRGSIWLDLTEDQYAKLKRR
jgi:hypothetical protein